MKVLSTEGLTKLIQLVKGAFISVDDTVQTTEVSTTPASEINVSRVAITGSYSDLNNKPTIPSRTSQLYNDSGYVNSTALNNKQDRLISGDNIKTINGDSILGSGDLVIQGGGDPINNRDGVSHLPMWEGTQTQWNQYSNSTWYDWETGPIPVWSEGGKLPSSGYWFSIAYGNGTFVAVARSSDKAAYSTDGGQTWTESTLPSRASWSSIAYGNGVFVTVDFFMDKAAYSTDGINWTESTLPSSGGWLSIAYGDGKFVVIAGNSSSKVAYSTDGGQTWSSSTIPGSKTWDSIAYGDGKFVALTGRSIAYSTDGINWTASTLPSSLDSASSITYGNSTFVVIDTSSDKAAYSTDGINWTVSTLPSSDRWASVTYGDGKFVAIAGNFVASTKAAYSTDGGQTWIASTLPSSATWKSVTYGDGKFVAVADGSDSTAIFSMSAEGESCYTLDENPTTSSIVYESPNNRSNLTVTSYDSGLGTLTLSDGNTYEYTASSDITAWRNVADAHPDWLCHIEGVGVKVGNTMIANEGSVVAGCTNAEIQNIWENN